MSRMLKWLFFTAGFGLLPFGFAWLLHYVHDGSASAVRNSPELLFVSLLISATVAGDLEGHIPSAGWRRHVLGTAFAVFITTAVLSGALYGVWADHVYNSPGRAYGLDCEIFRTGGVAHPEVIAQIRASAAGLQEACGAWLEILDRVFRLSVWGAVGIGGFGFAAEMVRPSGGGGS